MIHKWHPIIASRSILFSRKTEVSKKQVCRDLVENWENKEIDRSVWVDVKQKITHTVGMLRQNVKNTHLKNE